MCNKTTEIRHWGKHYLTVETLFYVFFILFCFVVVVVKPILTGSLEGLRGS